MDSLLLFYPHYFYTTLIFIFIFGAIIGSFLNVIIYRYPLMLHEEWEKAPDTTQSKKAPFNLCFPRSHCPHCKKNITWWMNIPLLSFIMLRGQCFYGKHRIGQHYFLTELITAITTLIIFLHFGFSLHTLILLIFTDGLIVLSMIDFNHQILPDTIVYILLWLGLIASTQSLFVDSTQAIFGAILGYLFLWGIAQAYVLLRKTEGLGLGDCKMLAMIGVFVGYAPLMNVVLCSAMVALICTAVLLACKKIHKQTLIPFGPFIAIAGWANVIYGDFITQWITAWLM